VWHQTQLFWQARYLKTAIACPSATTDLSIGFVCIRSLRGTHWEKSSESQRRSNNFANNYFAINFIDKRINLFLVNIICCFIDSIKKLSIIWAKTVVQQLNTIKIGLICVQKVTIKCTLANILFLVIV